MLVKKIYSGIKAWSKTQAAVMSFFLFVAFLILMFLASPIIKVAWQEETINFWNDILVGIATGLIGIVFTISFVQSALDKQAEKDEKVNEYKKVIRYSKYLGILINEYVVYFNSVVTPLDKRGIELDKGFISGFTLKDMSGMYYSSTLLRDGYNTPTIKKFYDAEAELANYLLRWNEEIDFKYSKNLEVLINDFLSMSKKLDSRGNILSALEVAGGKERLSETITKELKNESIDYIQKFNDGQLESNIMTPVVYLYLFLNMQQEYIIKINAEIDNIKNELERLEAI